jgi:4a-hydroxytetrahydrobiopterin dehydratase
MRKKSALLNNAELTRLLRLVPLWSLNKKQTELTRTFTHKGHIDALVFIARITVHAQVLNHHPTITFTYAKVKVALTTHDVGGLTKLDVELAKHIDALVRG